MYVRPVIRAQHCEVIDFRNGDECRSVIVDRLDQLLDAEDIDILQCPSILHDVPKRGICRDCGLDT